MRKIYLTLGILFGILIYGSAQCGEITQIEKGLFKKKVYKLCDIELTDNQFIALFADDEQYKDIAKPLAINYGIYILSYTLASALILYPVIESFYENGDPNWNLAYIGAGLVAISIPFKIKYQKKAAIAAEAYNKRYRESASLTCNFKFSTTGVGLVMKL